MHQGKGSPVKINELRDNMSRVDAEGEITDISEPRTVNLRTGGQSRVAEADLRDDTGTIKLSLWGDQIEMVKVGARVKVESGYTRSFRGEIQLNIGRYGKLNILE
jgi:replication factor A1